MMGVLGKKGHDAVDLSQHFLGFLQRAHFRDMGTFFLRGPIVIKYRVDQKTVTIQEFRAAADDTDFGELEAFLDFLISDAATNGYTVVFERPVACAGALKDFGFADTARGLVYAPVGAKGFVSADTLWILTAAVAVLLYAVYFVK